MEYYKLVLGIMLIYGLASQCESTKEKRAANNTLVLTTILAEPYMMRVEGQTNADGSYNYKGFLIDFWNKLVQEMGNKYNNYKIVEVKDNSYGRKNSDGTWNGMIGELISKEADIALASLSITSMRETVVDFSQPYLNIESSVVLRKDLEIDDVEELLQNEEVSYGCISSGRTMSLFKQHTDPTVAKMFSVMKSKDPSVFEMSNSKAIVRVKQEKYAYIGESTTLDYIVAADCELTSFPFEYFPETGLGVAFQKGSKYTSEFSSAILSLRESGEIQRLYNKWWKQTCAESSGVSMNRALGVGSLLLWWSTLLFLK